VYLSTTKEAGRKLLILFPRKREANTGTKIGSYFYPAGPSIRKAGNKQIMKFILIDGGPASGKSTLGQILVNNFNKLSEKTTLLDLDSYVEKYCPTWIWNDERQKEADLLNARTDFTNEINKFLEDNFIVIAIGDRFLTHHDVLNYTDKLMNKVPVYLYHLSVPFALRKQRLRSRGPHSLINLEKDQKDRDGIKNWPGYVYENVNSPEEDANNMLLLIQQDKGLFQNG
jgi:thymidylate kinase